MVHFAATRITSAGVVSPVVKGGVLPMNCPMCPAWMTGAVVASTVVVVLLIVLLVVVIMKVARR
jgi:hypothetical protein